MPARRVVRCLAALAIVTSSAMGAPIASGALWPDVPDRIKSELASPDVARRRAAAAQLGELPKEEALPLLQSAITDTDVDVRLAASDAAARRGVTEVSDLILPWLTDNDAKLREGACDFFAKLPQQRVVKVLARALGDTVPEVRLAAVRALGNSGSNDAVAPLLARLDDPNSKIRLSVARALSRIGDKRAVTPLVSKAQDEASEVRQAVVRALGELGDPRAAPALIITLNDQAVEVRIEALAALGRLHAAEAVPSIAPLTVDSAKKTTTPDVRRAALASLGRIASPAAIDAIVRSFGQYEDANSATGSSPARDAAITAGAPAAAVLLTRLRDGTLVTASSASSSTVTVAYPVVAASAAFVLGELHTDGAGDVIVKAMRRGEVPPAIAMHALASLGDPAQLPICLEAVAAPERPVRLEALVAAARLLDPDRPDGRAVEPLLASLDVAQTAGDRAEIATLLGRTGAERVAPVLIGLTSAKDEVLKLAAIEALGTLGSDKAGPTLLKLLDDPSGTVRLRAAIALGRAGGASEVPAAFTRLTTAAEADRLALVLALGGLLERHGDAAAVDLARGALSSGVGAERDLLVVGVGRTPAKNATALLTDLLSTAQADIDTRRAVAVALGARIGDASAAASLRLLAADVDPSVRAQAAWSLGAVGEPSDVPLLEKLSRDSAVSVAANAVASLGAVGARAPAAPAPSPAICASLEDDRPYVRADGLGALLLLARAGRPAACGDGARERALLGDDGNEVVRMLAARLAGATQTVLADGSSAQRAVLERCALVDPSGAVAALCRDLLRAPSAAAAAPATTSAPAKTSALVVFIAPEDGGAPIARSAYAIERPDGLLHLGAADRRGAVVELFLGKGSVRLRVASAAADAAASSPL